jgi:hypothetical protein
LIDASGRFDADLFPSFAALARDAIWFRNATAVAERTGTALPSIVTGRFPRPKSLPSHLDHPENLFAWLGASHSMRVFEPITMLCPTRLCDTSETSRIDRLLAIVSDLSTVYLHIVAPEELAARLPAVNQNWRDFDVPVWQQRWRRQGRADRRDSFMKLLESVQAPADRPTFYFAHVLLPHEPFVYLPSGSRYDMLNRSVVGFEEGERWSADPWPVAVNWQRELLQIQHVDALLGRLLQRLRDVGLYDRAVILVTADHGAAFVPGEPFKDPNGRNFAEIMAVPFLLKLPGSQDAGRVDDSNVETVDIVPTVSEVLGSPPPWSTDGRSVLSGAPRPQKRIAFGGGELRMDVSPAVVAAAVRDAVRRKIELFGSPPDLYRPPAIESSAELVGRTVAGIGPVTAAGVDIALDDGGRFTDVDLRGAFVPVLISGKTASIGRTGAGATVAVAINGVVRSVARTFYRWARVPGVWMALVPASALRDGMNRVEILEVVADSGRLNLRKTRAASPGVSRGNLLERAAASALGVRTSGFHGEERAGDRFFRWTHGRARVEVPFDPAFPPATLSVGVVHGGPSNRSFEIRAADCPIYRGVTPPSGSLRTFPLEGCTFREPSFAIEIVTQTFTPGGKDTRQLGIAVDFLSLRSR